jgi:hypothetical protein
MAEVKEAKNKAQDAVEEQTNGSSEENGGTGRAALRAAAIAAASGATAIAARKALSSRSDSDEGDDGEQGERRPRKKQSSGGGADSVLTTALSTGWESARDTVVPMLGNAAVQAGEYVARSSPELVRDTIVPQFIRGFESARKNSDDGDDDE